MSRLLASLDRFWFADAPAARLGVLRLLVGSYATWLLQFRFEPIVETSRLPASQFVPVGATSFLSGPPSPSVVLALLILAVVFSVPFVLGLAYRVTGPLFAGLMLFILTYYASWGSVNHPDALLTAHVLVLGLTRAADAVSLDALIRRWRERRGQPPAALPDPAGAWQYGFAINLVCAVTAMSYVLAGIAKLSAPSGWGSGEGLLRQVAWDGLRKELFGQPPPPEAAWMYGLTWLFTLLAIGTLVAELGAPLALANRRLGYVWAAVSCSMHWGIYLVMGIAFRYYLWGVAYASFFPLERLLLPFRWHVASPTRVRTPATERQLPLPFAPAALAPRPAPTPRWMRRPTAYLRRVGTLFGMVAGRGNDAARSVAHRGMLVAALLSFAVALLWAMTERGETAYSWPAAMLIVVGGACATVFLVVNEPSR